MARKYPSELNSRTVRVNLRRYSALKELSERLGITMDEALERLLDEHAERTVSPR